MEVGVKGRTGEKDNGGKKCHVVHILH